MGCMSAIKVIAQNPVIQDTETPSDSGNAGRQAADGTKDDRRQTRSDTDPPPDSGHMVATNDTATTTPAVMNPAWMEVANADFHLGEMLAALFDADAAGRAAIKDTAINYYDAIDMSVDDKATAAYVAASAHSDLGDRPNGLLWITRALELKPGERSFLELRTALQPGREP